MRFLARSACLLLFVFSSSSFAIPFANPDPATFGSDYDGNGYFSRTSTLVISVEAYDAFNADTGVNLEFGFYFPGAPSDLFTIFGPAEPQNAVALIDFDNGYVVDLEDYGIESTFTPSTASDYGFYLTVDATTTVYSDPLLNGGYDLFGAFPMIIPEVPDGTFAAMFFDASPEDNGSLLYAAPIVSVVSDVSEPESFTLALLGLMIILMVSYRRRQFTA